MDGWMDGNAYLGMMIGAIDGTRWGLRDSLTDLVCG